MYKQSLEYQVDCKIRSRDIISFSCPKTVSNLADFLSTTENASWIDEGFTSYERKKAQNEISRAFDKADLELPRMQSKGISIRDAEANGIRLASLLENLDDCEHIARRNIESLFRHFEISIGERWNWKVLALALAHKFIPDFSPYSIIQDDVGAPVKWTIVHKVVLVAYTDKKRAETGLSVEAIFQNMKEEVRKFFFDVEGGTLRTEYYAAKKNKEIALWIDKNKKKHGPEWLFDWMDKDKLELRHDRDDALGLALLKPDSGALEKAR